MNEVNINKTDDGSTTVFMWIMIAGMLVMLVIGAWAVMIGKAMTSRPCGYVDHNGKISPGYSLIDSCWSCSELATLSSSSEELFEEEMEACPKMYTDHYNKLARTANEDLVRQGYKPSFKILKRDK